MSGRFFWRRIRFELEQIGQDGAREPVTHPRGVGERASFRPLKFLRRRRPRFQHEPAFPNARFAEDRTNSAVTALQLTQRCFDSLKLRIAPYELRSPTFNAPARCRSCFCPNQPMHLYRLFFSLQTERGNFFELESVRRLLISARPDKDLSALRRVFESRCQIHSVAHH